MELQCRFPPSRSAAFPRPAPLIEALAAQRRHRPGARAAVRRGGARHDRALRGHRLAGHHRRRAAQVPQLLDLLRARRCRTPRPTASRFRSRAGHVRRMPRLTRGPFRYSRYADSYLDVALRYAHVPVKQAVISPSALSLLYPERGDPRLLARAVHRRPAARARDRGAPLPAQGRAQGADRLHRGPAGGQDRSARAAAAQLHRSEQPRAVALLGGRAAAHRRPHLPGQRPRLDPQRRCRLRRAAAEPVRARGRQLLRRAGRRARPGARAADHPPATEAGSARLRRRRRADRPAHRDRRGGARPRAARRPSTSRSSSSAPPTTAASRRSATTPRRPARPRSRRSARASQAPRWRRGCSESTDGDRRRRGRRQHCAAAALRNAESDPARRVSAPRRSCAAPSRRSSCGPRS